MLLDNLRRREPLVVKKVLAQNCNHLVRDVVLVVILERLQQGVLAELEHCRAPQVACDLAWRLQARLLVGLGLNMVSTDLIASCTSAGLGMPMAITRPLSWVLIMFLIMQRALSPSLERDMLMQRKSRTRVPQHEHAGRQ